MKHFLKTLDTIDGVVFAVAAAVCLLAGAGWWTVITAPLSFVLAIIGWSFGVALRNYKRGFRKNFALGLAYAFRPSLVERCPKCGGTRWAKCGKGGC